MIPIAKSLQEAINHFANNNSPIFCKQGKKAKKIRYKVTPIKK